MLPFRILKDIAFLSRGTDGWKKEITVTSWHGATGKLDIRYWESNFKKAGKGTTLTREEAGILKPDLEKYISGAFAALPFGGERRLCTLSSGKHGWKKEVRIVSRGGYPELDIRYWNPGGTKPGMGIALTRQEAGKLKPVLEEYMRGGLV